MVDIVSLFQSFSYAERNGQHLEEYGRPTGECFGAHGEVLVVLGLP